jgi:DNA polymerase
MSVKLIEAGYKSNTNPRIMILGEAPGAEEEKAGKPFVGKSGKLLDKMLESIKLDRSDCYITNVVKVRCTSSTISYGDLQSYGSDKIKIKDRAPTDEEIKSWLPLLRHEIWTIQPDLIVTLGSTACKALLNQGMSNVTAIEHDVDVGDGLVVTALPLWHPAYVLRKPSGMKAYERQWKLVKEILETKQVIY